MTVRPIRLIGDPVLRTACAPVTRFDGSLARLVADLIDTVQLPGRAGLAANQIGVSLAVFSYNVDGRLGYVVNPVLADVSGGQDGWEGCLSIPGVSAGRHRAAHAMVTGVDADGQPVTVSGDGEMARCLQHETGHLNGELYIDELAANERRRVMRELRRQELYHAKSGLPISGPRLRTRCADRVDGGADTGSGDDRVEFVVHADYLHDTRARARRLPPAGAGSAALS